MLWDIDGTLVDSAGLGLDAFVEAFERIVGHPPAEFPPFAGRTDLEIAHEMFELDGGTPSGDVLARFETELIRTMAARQDELARRGRALPGTHEALELLGADPQVIQSLLTGNIAPNARVKLAPFGLDRLLDFDSGAYGSDHRVRGELVAIARTRAERKHGIELDDADVVLIGDTPLDVAAALAGGARAVGVATGPFTEHELSAAGAHAVLPDLSDAERVRRAVLETA